MSELARLSICSQSSSFPSVSTKGPQNIFSRILHVLELVNFIRLQL